MLDWLKGAALVAFIGLCISTTYTVVTVGKHISNTLMETDETVTKLNTEIDELHRFTLEAALTASEARKASIKESKMLDAWNEQIAVTLTGVQNVMYDTHLTVQSIQATSSAAQDTLRATTQTIQSFQAPVEQLTATLKAGQSVADHLDLAVEHIDALVGDPEIKDTIHHVDSTLSHVDGTTADVQHAVHKYVYPGPWARAWGYVSGVGIAAGKFFIP